MNEQELRAFAVVRRHVAAILGVEDGAITSDRSLRDLGANSLDRVEIVTLTMEDLGLRFALRELKDAGNIGGLVRLLGSKLER
jgi:polyketide biosynthesis acyl carrier protein